VPGPQPRLHLPFSQWPLADKRLWQQAMTHHDDPFCSAAGAHLSERSRRQYQYGWRRFLGFLTLDEPTALEIAPAERLTKERVKRFVLISAPLRSTTIEQGGSRPVERMPN